MIMSSYGLSGFVKEEEIQLDLRKGVEMTDVIRFLTTKKIDILDIRTIDQELEDIFFKLVDKAPLKTDEEMEGVK